jgi:hypothetical protein
MVVVSSGKDCEKQLKETVEKRERLTNNGETVRRSYSSPKT